MNNLPEAKGATRSSSIRLEYMPQQAWVRAAGDDWTGIIDRKERRRLQNRHNQRAYRLRRKGIVAEPPEDTSSTSSTASLEIVLRSPSDGSHVETAEDLQCTHAPPYALQFRQWFEATARDSYLRGSPKTEHLISLSRLNVHRAIIENICAIGMTNDWTKSDDSISIFNLVQPGFQEGNIPPSLRPTLIQRSVPHHPWLDFFPFPHMRDNLITAGDMLDDDDLCHDLMAFWDTRNTGATLLVWGEPSDPNNWEVTEGFARKWGWLLRGCSELLVSSNRWRMRRGERPLIWRQVLQLQ
ncbi:hypothetical protein BDV32DRAFT_147783 [Aspergillus pseudonomiae]|uniref:Uncharacterized protein n=1 Tax=Aspergillus pseudonomiae TaxID=1506151 RepID=A0A5N6I640_9EURO|nr:uncharacterized protein BDV37DRAFT_252150 [Aspergillus pseudonomiae]KAB8262132.1 hypothetical protein BDV32DRAFT_147783 [Aspergillus pseudonomiae]KAE8402712.1 hypothetical protein BDV37DRAFT_252150 [Aspergillus pseudonomiae]